MNETGSDTPSAAVRSPATWVRSWLRGLTQADSASAASAGILSLKRREWLLIAALVIVSCGIHLALRMRGFGEQDEARFGIYALAWHHTGQFPIDTYTNRTSPLYLIYMRLALASGLSPLALPSHLNFINVFAGSLALLPMVLLFRSLTDFWSAFFAAIVYWFVPAFWIGNSYGMPHIPALALMLGSLVLYTRSLDLQGTPHRKTVALSALCMVIAAGLKSDIVLSGLAFPGVAWCARMLTRRNLLVALAIPALAVVTTIVVSRVFLPVPVSASAYAQSWRETFPFTLDTLRDKGHWTLLEGSLGGVFWRAAAVALLLCLLGKYRRLALVVLAWAVPPFVFWGLISANGIRHFTVALSAVAVLLVLGVKALFRLPILCAVALGLLTIFNYNSMPATDNPHTGTPRLFESHRLMQQRNSKLMESGRLFALDGATRKLLVGYWAIPYCEYAILARAERFERRVIKDGVLWEFEVWPRGASGPTFVRVRRGPQPLPERNEGWLVWNAELGRAL